MRQDGEAHTIARPSRPRTWPSERIAPVGPRLRSAEPSGQGTGSRKSSTVRSSSMGHGDLREVRVCCFTPSLFDRATPPCVGSSFQPNLLFS